MDRFHSRGRGNQPVSGKKVLRGFSCEIAPGEILALVGESGCGKSTVASAIMRLLPSNASVPRGTIEFSGRNLLELEPDELRRIRGSRISIIYQEHMSGLNPVLPVGRQLEEILYTHMPALRREKVHERCVALLREVEMPDPEQCLRKYPHQLSGGMRQRIGIAMALICHPVLLIADEPTTGLDVTVQASVLQLIRRLSEAYRMAVLFITHDLGVVENLADRVLVMYGGYHCEDMAVSDFFSDAGHPYSGQLLAARPELHLGKARLDVLSGVVPAPFPVHWDPKGQTLPDGRDGACPFALRCPEVRERCRTELPDWKEWRERHGIRCFYPLENEKKRDSSR